ncbi:MAG: DivIVA domain-containing protein [Solirubrobacterales bacterium]|nr:DivIVA domain-containing protein [Solirubrobacterales bacterium]
MALDRQSIEKKDFPVGRRGYDPEAVDAHLSALADEVSDLKRSARRRTDSLASAASDHVRSIVEAAESSAAEIQRNAEDDAREIRDEANSEAQATREQATQQAREYVGKVSESTDGMLKRLDAMESELGQLIESLRSSSTRLGDDLRQLEGGLSEVSGAVAPRPRFEPEAAGAETAVADPTAPPPAPDAPAFGRPGDAPLAEEPLVEPAGEAGWPVAPAGEADPLAGHDAPTIVNGEVPADHVTEGGVSGGTEFGSSGEDTEGARLIALNMALNGTPREETAKYLRENFSLTDAGGLLDEVYASVEG